MNLNGNYVTRNVFKTISRNNRFDSNDEHRHNLMKTLS